MLGDPIASAPVLFTMMGGVTGPTSRIELGLSALVALVADVSAPVPARVMGWWPQSGRSIVVPIDSTSLQRTFDAVVEAVRGVRTAGSSAITFRPARHDPLAGDTRVRSTRHADS